MYGTEETIFQSIYAWYRDFNSSYQNKWIKIAHEWNALSKNKKKTKGEKQQNKNTRNDLFHLLLKIICAQHLTKFFNFSYNLLYAHAHIIEHFPPAWNITSIYFIEPLTHTHTLTWRSSQPHIHCSVASRKMSSISFIPCQICVYFTFIYR